MCNPPFHSGATVHAGVALRMLADARRVLKPGGELWVVFNTHLGYRDYLNRTVGPTRQAGRNSKFTVTVSVRAQLLKRCGVLMPTSDVDTPAAKSAGVAGSLKAKPRPCDRSSNEDYRDGSGVLNTTLKASGSVVNSQQWSFHEQHFASARLQHYLDACAGDPVAAMRLYEWNAAVSAAFWESLSFLEVGLRNAIDSELTSIHESKGRAGHWIFDDAKELGRDRFGPRQHKQPYKDVAIAIERVRRNGMPVSPGQIISEISFGFWHQMVSKSQLFLWPGLAGAFPNSPNRGQRTVQEPVARLRDFRNRIGHHHRIWSNDLAAHYDDLLTVARYLDVDFASWIDDRSRVVDLLAQKL